VLIHRGIVKFISLIYVVIFLLSAAKIAKGDILYFTDDDMIADFRLLEEIIRTFNIDIGIGVVTGKISPLWLESPPNWVLSLCNNYLLSLNDLGNGLIISRDDIGAFSCHLAILRSVFFRTGGFHPENTDGIWVGDGETGLNQVIKRLGYKFAYNGMSKIQHMIPASRMTQSYLNKRLANQGNCDVYTEYRKSKIKIKVILWGVTQSLVNIFINIISMLIISCLNYFRISFKKPLDNKWRMKRAYISYWKSQLIYYFVLLVSKKRRKMVNKKNWLYE
jgi:hypothetical protein